MAEGKCPKCNTDLASEEVELEVDAGGGHMYKYKCPKCSFEGYEQWNLVFVGHFDKETDEEVKSD